MDKPWVADPATRDRAVLSLFFEVREDSTYPAQKMTKLVHQLVDAQSGGAPSFRYGEAAGVLSNRKLELPYAERLAREGLKHTASYLNEFGYFFSSVGEQADALDASNASLYDQLGWVFYATGRLTDRRARIKHALD